MSLQSSSVRFIAPRRFDDIVYDFQYFTEGYVDRVMIGNASRAWYPLWADITNVKFHSPFFNVALFGSNLLWKSVKISSSNIQQHFGGRLTYDDL